MRVPALIMAGGKGKRMGLPVEKPLLPFLGKPLIDWVVEAVAFAEKVSEFLDKVVKAFEACGKDFLAVFVPIKAREDLGLSVSSTDEYNGVWYAVAGVNIVNGKKIREEGKIETSAIITEEQEVLLNINTLKDLEIAEKIIQQKQKK